jgi:hypothetical protein
MPMISRAARRSRVCLLACGDAATPAAFHLASIKLSTSLLAHLLLVLNKPKKVVGCGTGVSLTGA